MKVRFTSGKSRDPFQEKGVRIPYAPARRTFPRWRWYFVVLLVSSPLLFFIAKVSVGVFWATSPGVIFMEKTPINSPTSGVLMEVHLREGQHIALGDVMAKVADPTLEMKRAPLTAERKVLMDYASRHISTEPFRDALVLAERVLKEEKAYRSKIQELVNAGAATKADLNEAQKRVLRAESDVIKAKIDLNLALAPSGEYKSQQVRLAQIDGELAAMADIMGGVALASPVSGVVLAVFAVVNQALAQGAPLAVVADPQTASIVTFLNPKDLGFVEKGKRVRIRFPEGTMVEAFPVGRPTLAEPAPLSLSKPLTEIRQTVRVTLSTRSPIPEAFLVEGLPVTVHWGGRWPW